MKKREPRKNGVMTAEEKFVVARFRTEIVVTSENGAPLSFFDHGMAESDIERGRKTFKSGKNGPL